METALEYQAHSDCLLVYAGSMPIGLRLQELAKKEFCATDYSLQK